MIFIYRNKVNLVLVFLCLCAFVNSTSATPSASNEMGGSLSFQLHILKEGWVQLKLGYKREQSWTVLEKMNLEDSEFVFTEKDIDVYDWTKQSVVLTSEASVRLRERFPKDKYLPIPLSQRGFVVTLEGEKFYGGIFLEPMSAMAISYPVIYPDTSQDKIVFSIRPVHSVLDQYQSMNPSLKATIEIQRIHDFFLKLGKLIK